MSRPFASAVASSSRQYATKAPVVPDYIAAKQSGAGDNKIDTLKRHLYPQNTFAPKSESPTGQHHPDVIRRVKALLPTREIHSTIEKAWALYQDQQRMLHRRRLRAKFRAMEKACDELDKITRPPPLQSATGGFLNGQRYPRALFNLAMEPANPHAFPKPSGRKISPEARWKEARLDGFVPREAWIPTETKGTGWNYQWQRPRSS
jgi:large subunit ribosomal protein L40